MKGIRMEHRECKQIVNAKKTLYIWDHIQHLVIKQTLCLLLCAHSVEVWGIKQLKKSEKVLQKTGLWLVEDQGDVKKL